MIPAEAVEVATEPQPEPCEYCSIAANELKLHDGSCDGMTEQEWRELKGEGVGHE